MSAADIIDPLAAIVGVAMGLAAIPQLVRVLRLGHSDDLTPWTPSIIVFGAGIWTTYGIVHGLPEVIVGNGVGTALNALLVAIILMQRDRTAAKPVSTEALLDAAMKAKLVDEETRRILMLCILADAQSLDRTLIDPRHSSLSWLRTVGILDTTPTCPTVNYAVLLAAIDECPDAVFA